MMTIERRPFSSSSPSRPKLRKVDLHLLLQPVDALFQSRDFLQRSQIVVVEGVFRADQHTLDEIADAEHFARGAGERDDRRR